jgi:hypothetical protein
LGELRFNFAYSSPRYWIKLNGTFHGPATVLGGPQSTPERFMGKIYTIDAVGNQTKSFRWTGNFPVSISI